MLKVCGHNMQVAKGVVISYCGGVGERAAIFGAPIWGGLKFSQPAFSGELQFLGAFRRCARTNGFLCY